MWYANCSHGFYNQVIFFQFQACAQFKSSRFTHRINIKTSWACLLLTTMIWGLIPRQPLVFFLFLSSFPFFFPFILFSLFRFLQISLLPEATFRRDKILGSFTKGHHSQKSNRNLKQKPWKNTAHYITCPCLTGFLILTVTSRLGMEWYTVGWTF